MRSGLALLLLAAAGASAAPCTPEALRLDRGETRRLVLCAEGLAADAVASATPGIAIRYQQRLRHCGIGDNRPGFRLVVEAADDAASGRIETGAAACPAIAVEIPDWLRLPDATLARRDRGDDRHLRLDIRAPAGVDLSPACATGPDYPAADGLTLGPAPEPRRDHCGPRRLSLDVTALDDRQQPAKILLPAVRGPDGRVTAAVTYASPPSPRWLTAMPEREAKYVEIGGVRTRYFEKGRGEALVLVHGGQPSSMDGTAWDWQQNFDGLAERFHVFALDRIGQGYTDNPANLDEYRDYYPRVVAHVQGFIEAMGLARVHLVGHSQGSWPVTRIALDHPERVASLTLVDGTMVAPSRDGGSALRFYLYLTQDLHPAGGETLESARRGMEFFSHTRNNLTEQRIERLVAMTRQPKFAAARAWFAKSGMSPAHPAFRALKAQVVADLEAGKLQVPVLVVWGNNDPEGSLPSGLELFRLVSASSPRARLHVFGRSGHLSFIEYPEAFNRLLAGFALDGN